MPMPLQEQVKVQRTGYIAMELHFVIKTYLTFILFLQAVILVVVILQRNRRKLKVAPEEREEKSNKNTALATSMENNHNIEQKEMELIHKERESNYKKRKREMKFDRKVKIDERKLDLAEKKLEMKRQEFILQSLKDDCATEANYLGEGNAIKILLFMKYTPKRSKMYTQI